MNVKLKVCTTETEMKILQSMQQMYLHDLSEYADDLILDDNGRFDNDDIEQYFKHDGLKPILIKQEESIVGFVLLNERIYTPPNVDYFINDIFVYRGMRKKGIALEAIKQLFEKYSGKYALDQLKKNQKAIGFWRDVFAKLEIQFEEKEIIHDGHECIYQSFNV